MRATPEALAKTRAFARVLGPYLAIVPGIIAVRAPDMGPMVSAFFGNVALVWITGALILFAGLFVIAQHQHWASAAAIFISLFGWFLALRGLALLAVPEIYAQASEGVMGAAVALTVVRIGFGALVLAGLWLTYVGWIAKPVP
ncbi:MAG: hypothetical protein WCD20_03955 [Rhodomicrobium sp.]